MFSLRVGSIQPWHCRTPADVVASAPSIVRMMESRSKPPPRHSVRGQAIAKKAFAEAEKVCSRGEYLPMLRGSMKVSSTTSC